VSNHRRRGDVFKVRIGGEPSHRQQRKGMYRGSGEQTRKKGRREKIPLLPVQAGTLLFGEVLRGNKMSQKKKIKSRRKGPILPEG